jgi:hypothetical protein
MNKGAAIITQSGIVVKSPFSIETNIHILKLYNKNNGIETELNHEVNCLYSQKK